MAAGVDCLKIEGRAKSAYYAAIVTGAYRHCLDAVAAGEPLDPVWRDEVEHISHRHYSTGFFYGQPGQYYEDARYLRDWQICAVVTDCTPDGVATMSLRNKFAAGDTVEIVGPDTKPFTITVPAMRGPEGEVLLMETNYRSAGAIVEKADAFIQRNGSRHPKHMRASRPQGEPVRHVNLNDFGQQAHYLAQAAADCTESTAVLYRNNDSALPLIDLLERRGIPYACRQRESFFFTSPAVRDLTDVLCFALDGTDRERFLRIYYKLEVRVKRSILQEKLRRVPEGAPVLDALIDGGGVEPWQTGRLKALRTHLSKLPQLSSFAALQRIVKYMGYGDYLSSQGGDKSRVELLLALARQEPGVEGFLRRLDALRDTVETGSGDPACPFVLSTIHASKGLEYDRVFLIDAVDGIFPSVNPRKGNDLSDEERGSLEEERRLFYVGATRARRQLVLLTCDNRFGEPSPPASFVGQFLGTPEWASQRPRTPGKAPAEPDAATVAAWEKDYLPGTAVVHRAFGPGMVVSRSGAVAVIAFDEVGTKKVELTACLRKRLLRLASAPDF